MGETYTRKDLRNDEKDKQERVCIVTSKYCFTQLQDCPIKVW